MATADSPGRTLARRAFLDARVRTIAFAYVFAAYAYIQPVGFRNAYATLAERLAFARSFGENRGIRLLYGEPHDIATVAGYTAWRVGGVLAIAAALFGLLSAVRAYRAEEDSGRLEIVLAGVVARRTASLAALSAIAAGMAILWLAELAGFAIAGLRVGSSAYLALATASVIPVCAGIGAVTSQLAPNRRIALGLGGAIVGVLFLLRVLADTLDGVGWLRWTTPLGWAEEMRPFGDARPAVLVLPIAATALLLVAAVRLAADRDVGTGVLPSRDTADPRLRLLSSPTAQALRSNGGSLTAWVGSVAVFGFIIGAVSKSVSPADVSENLEREIAKLGSGAITTPTGYLAFVFIFVALVACVFVCTQIGAARQEEAEQRLETLLALPTDRRRWLFGRVVLAVAGAAAIAIAAGLVAWAGARTAGADVSLPRSLEAGANCLPIAVLFLGFAGLAYAAAPRASAGIAYGVLTVAFIWNLVGALVGAPRWVVDLTPFAHVGLVPVQPFRVIAAAVMVALGAACTVGALSVFRRRDLIGG
jgi:ABC-2 type transport system permease protein